MRLRVLTALTLVLAAPLQAQLPTVQQVYDRFAEAVGGRAAWATVQARADKGTADITFAGLTGNYARYTAAPGLMRLTIDLGMGVVDQGFDGTVGWAQQPMGGAVKATPQQVAEMQEGAAMGAAFLDPSRYASAVVEGTELFDGVQCHKLKVTTRSGTERWEFFEVDSGLRRGMITKSPAGELRATSTDYKPFEGRKVATRLVQSTAQGDVVITLQSVSFAPLDASVFEAPAAVKTP
jgi:hypothetical protein